jgi:hypothetical protein
MLSNDSDNQPTVTVLVMLEPFAEESHTRRHWLVCLSDGAWRLAAAERK